MKITRIVVIPLVGLLVILGACASPAAPTAAIPAPTAAIPAPTPATPAPTPATPAPTPATPAPTPATPAPMTALIEIISDQVIAQAVENYGGEFRPHTIAVSVGTTVTWTNKDNKDHTVISNDGLFNKRLKYGESFSYTFTQNGSFKYHDVLYDSMDGTVIVK